MKVHSKNQGFPNEKLGFSLRLLKTKFLQEKLSLLVMCKEIKLISLENLFNFTGSRYSKPRTWWNEFFQKVAFFEKCVQIQRKTWENYEIYSQYCTSRYDCTILSVRKDSWKMRDIEANIEYFAFLNCCNLTFSQIENMIKFPKIL